MRKLLVALLCLGLASCAEWRAERIAREAAADNAKCLSYGAQRGDPAYVQCRAQLDAARTQAEATEAAAPAVNIPPVQAPQLFIPPPVGLPSPVWHP